MLKKKVQAYCELHGITVKEFKNMCELTNGTVSHWDKSSPTLASLQKIASHTDFPICELLEGDRDGKG